MNPSSISKACKHSPDIAPWKWTIPTARIWKFLDVTWQLKIIPVPTLACINSSVDFYSFTVSYALVSAANQRYENQNIDIYITSNLHPRMKKKTRFQTNIPVVVGCFFLFFVTISRKSAKHFYIFRSRYFISGISISTVESKKYTWKKETRSGREGNETHWSDTVENLTFSFVIIKFSFD